MAFVFNPFTGTLDHKLDIEGTTSEISELKLSYDATNYATLATSSTADLAITTVGSGNLNSDISLIADGDLIFRPATDSIQAKDASSDLALSLTMDTAGFNLLTIFDPADDDNHTALKVGANGETTLSTDDDVGNVAHLSIKVDGDTNFHTYGNFNFRAAADTTYASLDLDGNTYGPLFKLMSSLDTADYFSIGVTQHGSATIKTVDDGAAIGHLIFDIDGNIGIGAATPTAQLEIEQGSTGGTIAFKIDNNDTDQVAMKIEAANIDADVMDIAANTLTTGHVLDIAAAGLTTGSMLDSVSTSTIPDGSSQNLYNIYATNDSVGSHTSRGLYLDYNKTAITASGKLATIIGLYIDIDDSVNNVGDETIRGAKIDVNFANSGSGTTTATGLEIDVAGADTNIPLVVEGGPIKIKEQANPPVHVSNYGFLWVDDAAPNALYFTNDDDDDIQLTSGDQAIGTISLPADRLSVGDAQVNIASTSGDIVFKSNANTGTDEFLRFNTDAASILDNIRNPVTEIHAPDNYRFRIRAKNTQQNLQLMSGNSVDIVSNRQDTYQPTVGDGVSRFKNTESFYDGRFDWNDSATITHDHDAADGVIFHGLRVHGQETDGFPNDVMVGTIINSTSFKLFSTSWPYAEVVTTEGAHTDQTLWFEPDEFIRPTVALGTASGTWTVNQYAVFIGQVLDQDDEDIAAKLRGSTGGSKCTIRYHTGGTGNLRAAAGVPMIFTGAIQDGYGYDGAFEDASCDYNHTAGGSLPGDPAKATITHDDDGGKIKLFMSVRGAGIPDGAYVGEVDSVTQFKIHKDGGTGAVDTDDRVAVTATATDGTLTFRDRVVFQDAGGSDEYAVVEVDRCEEGIITFGSGTEAQKEEGNFNSTGYINASTSDFQVMGYCRLKLGSVNSGARSDVVIDADDVYLGSKTSGEWDTHRDITGQQYTAVFAGDRIFIGNDSCNRIYGAWEYGASEANYVKLWLLGDLLSASFKVMDDTRNKAQGGLELKVKTSGSGAGETTLTTRVPVGGTANTAHLNFDAGGHIAFKQGVGFDRISGVFNASNSTVDFRTGNKAYLDCAGSTITNLKFYFPAVSGNFILLLNHPASGCNISNYLAYDSDGDAATVPAVKFPSGVSPSLTNDEDHVDILSFFWDEESKTAYGIASLDFQN